MSEKPIKIDMDKMVQNISDQITRTHYETQERIWQKVCWDALFNGSFSKEDIEKSIKETIDEMFPKVDPAQPRFYGAETRIGYWDGVHGLPVIERPQSIVMINTYSDFTDDDIKEMARILSEESKHPSADSRIAYLEGKAEDLKNIEVRKSNEKENKD